MAANQIVLFQSSDGAVSLPVQIASESVWLSQAQMAQLFGKDRTVIGRHIHNAINEGEIAESKPAEKEMMVNLVMNFLA